MRCVFLICFVLSSIAIAQENAASADRKVQDNDPVITLNGYCEGQKQDDQNCRTVITRAQFDALCEALQPGMSVAQRLKVANAYARNLRMAAVAKQRGLDQTKAYALELEYARLQLLAQDLEQNLQLTSQRISEADITAYFSTHQPDFETAVFERIFIPHVGKSDSAEQMQQLAITLRERLMAGAAADSLQREAFERAGLSINNANTRIDKIRRGSLPPSHVGVMALEPGQVAALISDPQGAHFIYRMVDKRMPALAELQEEITKLIAEQRYRENSRAFQGDTVFSDAYFNPVAQPVAATARRNRAAP
jgi:hypothetical protein